LVQILLKFGSRVQLYFFKKGIEAPLDHEKLVCDF